MIMVKHLNYLKISYAKGVNMSGVRDLKGCSGKRPAVHFEVGAKALKTAKRVLTQEADGLTRLIEHLDDHFVEAVDAIHNMTQSGKGRLIIAGIGKSGNVGQKIAATMSSTGTPSHYINAAEASHGDLGCVTKDDVVLLLSNSGETAELSDIIHYTKRSDITLVCITSRPDSTLSNFSDISLIIPKLDEACINKLAPTTSTTMMMALGDAMAIALSELAGLTPDSFRNFHPGGKLGAALKTVGDLMLDFNDAASVASSATVAEALITMTSKNQGSIVVVNDNQEVEGIVTDGDIKRHVGDADFITKTVREIMSPAPFSVRSGVLASQALNLMIGNEVSTLVVTDGDQKFQGVIRQHDCLKAGLSL